MDDLLSKAVAILVAARQATLDAGLPVMTIKDDGTIVEQLKDGSVWFVKKIDPPVSYGSNPCVFSLQ